MANNTSNRGFAAMDEDKQREIASKGGHSQGKENNPGNLANRSKEDRVKTAKAGAANQPTKAKQEGGRNSRSTS